MALIRSIVWNLGSLLHKCHRRSADIFNFIKNARTQKRYRAFWLSFQIDECDAQQRRRQIFPRLVSLSSLSTNVVAMGYANLAVPCAQLRPSMQSQMTLGSILSARKRGIKALNRVGGERRGSFKVQIQRV